MVPRFRAGTTITGTFLGVLATLAGCKSAPENQDLILATTTSTQDSGLLDVLVPVFERETGYVVKTIAVGTGEALSMGGRGDADVLLVHAPEQEKAVVVEGSAINRRLVMHNDFLIVGPEEDPAGIHGSSSGVESVRKIAETGALFVSRGDDSGTHVRERSLWEAAGIDPGGDWYLSTGQGMGATLMIAAEKEAYTLTDRATHLSMRERTGLAPHAEGDPLFLNIYSVMEVNPERFPGVNAAGARAFSEFMVGPEAQEIIRGFGLEEFGQPLFVPDAGKSEEALGGVGGDGSPPGAG
jgi:tungstate transport system substrate-binding protein